MVETLIMQDTSSALKLNLKASDFLNTKHKHQVFVSVSLNKKTEVISRLFWIWDGQSYRKNLLRTRKLLRITF